MRNLSDSENEDGPGSNPTAIVPGPLASVVGGSSSSIGTRETHKWWIPSDSENEDDGSCVGRWFAKFDSHHRNVSPESITNAYTLDIRELEERIFSGKASGVYEGSRTFEVVPEGFRQVVANTHNSRQYGWIYKLVNILNGKAYVGKTEVRISKRMHGHRRAHRKIVNGLREKGCRALNNSIKKYGWESFRLEPLAFLPVSELSDAEIRLIDASGTRAPTGYNLTRGGDYSPFSDPIVRDRMSSIIKTPSYKKSLSDGVKRARKNRPDWIESTTNARRKRAEKEREARMKDMTPLEQARYLNYLHVANKGARMRRQQKELEQ